MLRDSRVLTAPKQLFENPTCRRPTFVDRKNVINSPRTEFGEGDDRNCSPLSVCGLFFGVNDLREFNVFRCLTAHQVLIYVRNSERESTMALNRSTIAEYVEETLQHVATRCRCNFQNAVFFIGLIGTKQLAWNERSGLWTAG
jgi:hypothetical protein